MLVGIKKILSSVPADCPACQKRTGKQKLCPECNLSLKTVDQRPRCHICDQVLINGICLTCRQVKICFDAVISAFDYKGLGQQLVHDYKIHKRLSLAGLLADLLVESINSKSSAALPDLVLVVPAHTDSISERGFSPAAELARLTAKKLKIPFSLDVLWRIRESAKQTSLNYQQRQTAQLSSYACNPDKLYAKNIAVVDDVMTTGATLNAIASILKQAGASSVQCWVLARTIR